MRIQLHTYAEVIEHLLDYLGGTSDEQTARACRRAAQSAYHDVPQCRKWSYYYQRGRVATSAPQSDGTVAYDHTGGTYERQLTLAGATWPSWAPQGTVVVGDVPYEADARKSATVLTLSVSSNPGDDVAAGAAYSLYRDTYPLPADCHAINEIVNLNNAGPLEYVHPADWLSLQRLTRSPGTPRSCTVTGDPNYLGTMALRMYPPPDQATRLDFIYMRRPRQLLVDEYAEGTASTTSGSLTLTGAGTTWTARMVNSVVRLSDSAQTKPTGLGGAYPYAVERVVAGFGSETSLTLDADPQQTLSGVRCSISDPVDIEEGAMWNYFLRECENQLRLVRRMDPTSSEERKLRDAMVAAFEADARVFQRRAAGAQFNYRPRLADMPRGPDVS